MNCKASKVWAGKGRQFYNRSMKSWSEENAIEMYSTHNESKSVVAARFIRNLKNKIYKCITSRSKNVYIDILDDIVNEHSNTYHSTIKMKPYDVISSSYINSSKEINDEVLNLKLVILLKYQNIKGYVPNWSEDVFVIKKVKTLCLGYWLLLVILKADKLLRRFTKNNCKNQIKKSCISNGKATIILLTVGLIKKT